MTIAGILAIICVIALLLFAYPYVIYPLILRLLDRQPVNAAPVDLSASLLFCAFNEIKGLPAKIDNLRGATFEMHWTFPDAERAHNHRRHRRKVSHLKLVDLRRIFA